MNNNLLIKLSFRHAKKKRNIFTLVAIILTTIFFTVLFTVLFGLLDSFEQKTLKQTNNSAHAAIMYISDEKYNDIFEAHDMYEALGYEKIISENIMYNGSIYNNLFIANMNEAAMDMTFCKVTEGNSPVKENEIAIDKDTLNKFEHELNIGDEITLQFETDQKLITKKFLISGSWVRNELCDIGCMLISDNYAKALLLDNSVTSNRNTYAYIQFHNKNKIEKDLLELVNECNLQEEYYNVNWAYLSNSVEIDYKLVLSIMLCVILIMFTGYLLINNIYQISLSNDVRYYGLLKTVGFTTKQLGIMTLIEALMISFLGMIIGETVGYIIGIKIFPLVIEMTNVEFVKIEANIYLFILSSIFVIVTVVFSIYKPYKILKALSPIEATKF